MCGIFQSRPFLKLQSFPGPIAFVVQIRAILWYWCVGKSTVVFHAHQIHVWKLFDQTSGDIHFWNTHTKEIDHIWKNGGRVRTPDINIMWKAGTCGHHMKCDTSAKPQTAKERRSISRARGKAADRRRKKQEEQHIRCERRSMSTRFGKFVQGGQSGKGQSGTPQAEEAREQACEVCSSPAAGLPVETPASYLKAGRYPWSVFLAPTEVNANLVQMSNTYESAKTYGTPWFMFECPLHMLSINVLSYVLSMS